MVEVWDQVDFSGRLAKSLGKVAMMALRRPTLVGAGMVAATRPPARQTAVRADSTARGPGVHVTHELVWILDTGWRMVRWPVRQINKCEMAMKEPNS